MDHHFDKPTSAEVKRADDAAGTSHEGAAVKLDFDTWCQATGGWKRFYVWQVPVVRKLFNVWYRMGGFYVSGWTPIVYRQRASEQPAREPS